MGVVWLARDQRDSSEVALKLLRPELSADEVYGRRFLREARIAAEVDHPNLVTIRDAGEAGGWAYIAARHVDGPTLAELLRDRGPLVGRGGGAGSSATSPPASTRCTAAVSCTAT